jgi:MoaA/NifB/PqqE/SkfB family radical SAM enzyme
MTSERNPLFTPATENEVSGIEFPGIDWNIITIPCNLACDFCYRKVMDNDHPELRDDIANALEASPAPTISFCGSEALLVRGVFEYARRFKNGPANKKVVLNSNLELYRRTVEREGDGPFTTVSASIEGPTPEIHGRIRKRHDGRPASLADTWDGALLAKEAGSEIKVATVVCGDTYTHLPETVTATRYGIGPDVYRWYQYNHNGVLNTGQSHHNITAEVYWDAVVLAKKRAGDIPAYPSDNESQACLVVEPNGDVEVTIAGNVRIGNCLEKPIQDIWIELPDEIRQKVLGNKGWQHYAEQNSAFQPSEQNRTGVHTRKLDLIKKLLSNTVTEAALRAAYIDCLPSTLPLGAAEAHWQHSARNVSQSDGRNLIETRRIVDRFSYFALMAEVTL